MTRKLSSTKSILFLFLVLTSGCASMIQQKELESYNSLYCKGQYAEAADVALKEKGDETSDPSHLLQSLQAAAALRYAGQYTASSQVFDECEDIIKYHNEQLMISDVGANVASVLLNDAVLDYRAEEYDGIMTNTYKALNFWQEGQNDMARVEFNRALDRQRRAKERFAAMIAKQREKLEKEQEEQNKKAKDNNDPQIDFQKNINNPEVSNILKEKYSNLYEFKAYPDFINPFTTYMAGLFFMSEGDYAKAADLLKETYGMVGENKFVQDDFWTVEKILGGEKTNDHFTWIVFENGLGPEKEEFRVDLPLFLLTDEVKYTGIALPKLKLRDQACSHLEIKNSNHMIDQTYLLASMDRVVQTEFKKKYPTIVTRAIISTLIKTYGQYMAKKKYGDLGGFAAAFYQGATTSADVRSWTSLPKEFQLAKIPTPEEGILTLEIPSGDSIDVTVPDNDSYLVYVKIPTKDAEAVVDIIPFRGTPISNVSRGSVTNKSLIQTRLHRNNSRSDMIFAAQKKLKDLGYDPGPVDGIMGNKTKRAITSYQADNGLQVTKKLDQNTIESLNLKLLLNK